MADLIDREELTKRLGIDADNCDQCSWGNKNGSYCRRGGDFEDACWTIYDMPSAETERKTGKWIPGKEKGRTMISDTVISIYYDHFTCSNCCQVYNTEQKPTWRFCPNCGAYMGGDE